MGQQNKDGEAVYPVTKIITPKFCLSSFNWWTRQSFVNFWSFCHSKVPSFSSWLAAPCLCAALQTSSCSLWPTQDLIQASCHKQVFSKSLFIFTCLIIFVHLFYCILCFSHDLGLHLSSTVYAAQTQFQCQWGTVFLLFHEQAASLFPSHLCSASCSLWLAVLSTPQMTSLVLRLPGLAALYWTVGISVQSGVSVKMPTVTIDLAEYQHKIFVLCHSDWKITFCFCSRSVINATYRMCLLYMLLAF